MAKQTIKKDKVKKISNKNAETTTTNNENPEYKSTVTYVEVELLQAVKIGKFTYSAGRTIGLKKETADDLIKDNKAKQV